MTWIKPIDNPWVNDDDGRRIHSVTLPHTGCKPAEFLTEDDVRRIVEEVINKQRFFVRTVGGVTQEQILLEILRIVTEMKNAKEETNDTTSD